MLETERLFTICTWCFAVISLVGAYLNVKRNRWGFFLWMLSNSFWMVWNFYITQYALSAQFACFLYLAVLGFVSWQPEYRAADSAE